MRRKRLFSIVIVTLFLSIFGCRYIAYAAGTTIVDPSSGPAASGCDYDYNTCTGMTWKYYAWPGGDRYVIPGSSTNANYQATVIEGEDARICAAVGGFYRYAFVNRKTGEQWGTMSLAAHPDNAMRSQKIVGAGGAHYRGPDEGGEDWDTVKAAYEAAHAAYPNNIPAGGFENGSGLRVFCASYGDGCPPGECNDDPDPDPDFSYCPGIAAPSSYAASGSSEGWSSVITKVRKTSVMGPWEDELWAKPGDAVTWRHCYFPGMQKVANTLATYDHPHSPTQIDNIASNTVFDNVKNAGLSSFGSWTNTYNIKNRSETASGSGGTNIPFAYGDSKVKSLDNNYNVYPDWVGNSSYEQSSLVGGIYHAKVWDKDPTCTWDCEYKYGCNKTVAAYCKKTGKKVCSSGSPVVNGHCQYGQLVDEMSCEDCIPGSTAKPCNGSQKKYVADGCVGEKQCTHATGVIDSSRDNALNGGKNVDSAIVKVPFNFNMSGTISLDGDVVYAGESAKLKTGSVTVEDRWNATTNGTYATRVEGVKVQVLTFVWGSPVTSVPGGANVRYGKEFEIGNMSANETKTLGQLGGDKESVNVDDETAGKYFCVAIQVSPASSGSDTTMNSNGFDKSYRRSGADCKPIAKRPSFQVWGNGVFSNGNIVSGRAVKNNLYGFTAERPYLVSGISDGNVFGSWAEHSVMALGTISGFGSGASLSGNKTLGSYMKYGLFESTPNSTGYCLNEIPQTFANFTQKSAIQICNSTATQGNAGQFATSPVVTDRTSYIESLVGKAYENVSNKNITSMQLGVGDTWDTITSETGKVVFYTKVGGNLTIDASTLVRGRTYVVHSTNGDITINGNINSQNDGYNSINDIPKLLIFANNIKINCGVTNIDGALIAKNKVDTCANSAGNNYNDAARSNQLIINGTVITNSMDMKRTYGAGVGSTSSVPAEIVNYDTTLILWARSKADTGDSGALNTTYTRELAPRY